MTSEFFRSFLYPIGLIAHLFFTLRFLFQWVQSERKKRSLVTKNFWIFSLYGNILMSFHAMIQMQYPLLLIQTFNAIISWRNLNLMKEKTKPLSFVFKIMALLLGSVTALFLLQNVYFQTFKLMRAPSFFHFLPRAKALPIVWHVLGCSGLVLFASRFWVQWWSAEKRKKSYLGKTFWWLSLIGGFFSLLYFIRLHDAVNILGYSFGLIPYLRNLMLLKDKPREKPLNKKIFIFSGEHSGDLIGAQLAEVLQEKKYSLLGVGGPLMKEKGVHLISDLTPFHVMGFTDVLLSLPRLFKAFQRVKKAILRENPAAVIFVDYPDFNMKMARALRKAGFTGKLIHYVCPSVWAWRKNRVKDLAKTLDLLITILPFESEYFKKTTLPIHYAGHPLVHAIHNHVYDASWRTRILIPEEKPLIALFPGSRKQEIEANLPLQLKAVESFAKTHQIVISLAHMDLKEVIRKFAKDQPLVPYHFRYECMREAKAALATSGTIILELGLHATPTIATYKVSFFNAFIARCLLRIRLPFYTLVNIICQRGVFPEFIHWKLSSKEIAGQLEALLSNSSACQNACSSLRTYLGEKNASLEAAGAIEKLMS